MTEGRELRVELRVEKIYESIRIVRQADPRAVSHSIECRQTITEKRDVAAFFASMPKSATHAHPRWRQYPCHLCRKNELVVCPKSRMCGACGASLGQRWREADQTTTSGLSPAAEVVCGSHRFVKS